MKGIPYMQMLKEMVNRDTRDKIAGEKARIEAEMRDKKFGYNIVLIGFMGTGKSTVSEYLSTMYNMETVEMGSSDCRAGRNEHFGNLFCSWGGIFPQSGDKPFGRTSVEKGSDYFLRRRRCPAGVQCG